VAEFNSGTAALSEAIRLGKEAAEKSVEAAKTAATAAGQRGALQLTISRENATDEVAVSLDGQEFQPVAGQSWAWANVPLGVRMVHIKNLTTKAKSAVKSLIVQANNITTDTVGGLMLGHLCAAGD
jgi:hypothetical protein